MKTKVGFFLFYIYFKRQLPIANVYQDEGVDEVDDEFGDDVDEDQGSYQGVDEGELIRFTL